MQQPKNAACLIAGVITTRYGEFIWRNKSSELIKEKVEARSKIWNRLGFLKWIIGGLPIAILIFLIQYVGNLTTIIRDGDKLALQTTFSYIAVSWCLLLFDRALNLGIVDNLVKIAQDIKEINRK